MDGDQFLSEDDTVLVVYLEEKLSSLVRSFGGVLRGGS